MFEERNELFPVSKEAIIEYSNKVSNVGICKQEFWVFGMLARYNESITDPFDKHVEWEIYD